MDEHQIMHTASTLNFHENHIRRHSWYFCENRRDTPNINAILQMPIYEVSGFNMGVVTLSNSAGDCAASLSNGIWVWYVIRKTQYDVFERRRFADMLPMHCVRFGADRLVPEQGEKATFVCIGKRYDV